MRNWRSLWVVASGQRRTNSPLSSFSVVLSLSINSASSRLGPEIWAASCETASVGLNLALETKSRKAALLGGEKKRCRREIAKAQAGCTLDGASVALARLALRRLAAGLIARASSRDDERKSAHLRAGALRSAARVAAANCSCWSRFKGNGKTRERLQQQQQQLLLLQQRPEQCGWVVLICCRCCKSHIVVV